MKTELAERLIQTIGLDCKEVRVNSLICGVLSMSSDFVFAERPNPTDWTELTYPLGHIGSCRIVCDLQLKSDLMRVWKDGDPLDISEHFTVFDFLPE